MESFEIFNITEQRKKELEIKYPYIRLVPEVLPYLPLVENSPAEASGPSHSQDEHDRYAALGEN